MLTITETIQKRFSCRTYEDRAVEPELLREFTDLVKSTQEGPFGGRPIFEIINFDHITPDEFKKLGTYGVIKKARHFLVGTIANTPLAMEDYGYCKEQLILKATAMGLGTCWLAGTFRASAFAEAIGLKNDMFLPSVSPVGYPADRKSFTERFMRLVAGSNNRKSWESLFFENDFSHPLTRRAAAGYTEALENVRLAPSASNKQPWRILREPDRGVFHFYLARSPEYYGRPVPLQDIDMGIAMSHFELTLRELGLKGRWLLDGNAPEARARDYIASWQEE